MMDLNKLEELQRGAGITLPVSADVDGRVESADAKFAIYDEGGATEQQAEYVIALLNAAPELVAAANESERSQRMFVAACEALGAVNEKLGLDPDDGGADPIIEAIDQLHEDLAAARRPAAEPLHDNLRDQIGQAINDAIASGAPQADYCDSREVDRLADAVLAILPPLRTNDDSTQRAATTTSLVELREHLHGAAQAGELFVLAPEAAGALVLAMSTSVPAGGAAPGCAKCGDVLPAGTYCKGISCPLNPSVIAAAPADAKTTPAKKFTTDEAREYLVEYMMENFTDKTFHRYIRGQIGGSGPLAGDFAWQLATALARQPVAPACPLTQVQIDHIGEQWDGCMYEGAYSVMDIGACLRRELALLAKIGGVK